LNGVILEGKASLERKGTTNFLGFTYQPSGSWMLFDSSEHRSPLSCFLDAIQRDQVLDGRPLQTIQKDRPRCGGTPAISKSNDLQDLLEAFFVNGAHLSPGFPKMHGATVDPHGFGQLLPGQA